MFREAFEALAKIIEKQEKAELEIRRLSIKIPIHRGC
jgi:hypothetical protein